MRVINDGNDMLALGVQCSGLGDKVRLAFVVRAIGFEIEGLAQEAQDAGSIGVFPR
ncbi:hypothetical protein ACFSSA_10885 [Luteolibacter algae]|uniref:Uncharacterized protein n=1 Tax=Luteolibacter algae TaxID=454151 RepID=A0ABW5D822_9BACT